MQEEYPIYTFDELQKFLINLAATSQSKKRKVAAAIVNTNSESDYIVITAGENFNPHSPTGSCEDARGNTYETTIHAEQHAINQLTENELDMIKATPNEFVLLTTHDPCDGCKAAAKQLGIRIEVMSDFMKFDSGKPRVFLVPGSLVNEVGKVVTYGAKKYKVNNWRNVKSQEPYLNALERHLIAFKSGETHDPESGLPHIAHIACNAAFLLELSHLPLIEGE